MRSALEGTVTSERFPGRDPRILGSAAAGVRGIFEVRVLWVTPDGRDERRERRRGIADAILGGFLSLELC